MSKPAMFALSEEWQAVAACVDEYELVRKDDGGELGRFVAHLPPEQRSTALAELTKSDLEYQWRANQRRHVEDYFARYPELAGDDDRLIDLIKAEFEVRSACGRPFAPGELRERFPENAERLEKLATSWAEGAAFEPTVEHDGTEPLEDDSEREVPSGGSDTAVTLPKRFGRYEIVRLLGKGGMGSVYLARDTKLDRLVALKAPHFASDADKRILGRFYREARLAATIHHPNVCPIYDVDETDGIHHLTMAYIEGRTLAETAPAGTRMEPKMAAQLVAKLAAAVDAAHARGVIHRDLKLANIMIDARGEPVVMDFGLARRFESTEEPMTRVGAIVGTPAYMSPEQVQGDPNRIGPATDVYSLGVILYRLLTGQLPFEGGDMTALVMRILVEVPRAPSALVSGLDARLDAICMRAMARRTADRYPSGAALAGDLDAFLRGAAIAAETTALPVPTRATPTLEDAQETAVGPEAAPAEVLAKTLVAEPAPVQAKSWRLLARLSTARFSCSLTLVATCAAALLVAVVPFLGTRASRTFMEVASSLPPGPRVASNLQVPPKPASQSSARLPAETVTKTTGTIADSGLPPPPPSPPVPPTGPPESVELKLQIRFQRGDNFVSRSVTDEQLPLRFGDRVRLEAVLPKPMYAYLFWYSADGTAVRLWPKNLAEQQAVTKVYDPPLEPTHQRQVWHELGGTPGFDAVLLATAERPLSEAELREFQQQRLGLRGRPGRPRLFTWKSGAAERERGIVGQVVAPDYPDLNPEVVKRLREQFTEYMITAFPLEK